jgi:hypothetical protein
MDDDVPFSVPEGAGYGGTYTAGGSGDEDGGFAHSAN